MLQKQPKPKSINHMKNIYRTKLMDRFEYTWNYTYTHETSSKRERNKSNDGQNEDSNMIVSDFFGWCFVISEIKHRLSYK